MNAWATRDWGEWPGKSPIVEGGIEHTAAAHMLDVAAVAECLIAPFSFEDPLRKALILLIGLHDLGKLSESFRDMLRDGKSQGIYHWQLSEALLYEQDTILEKTLGGDPDVRRILYGAVAGHHGRPSKLSLGVPGRWLRDFRKALKNIGEGLDAAKDLVAAFCTLWPNASVRSLGLEEASKLSWWLSGLCTTADWIGSNPDWFPPKPLKVSLPHYLDEARSIAKKAVHEAGLSGTAVKENWSFGFALRPFQDACATLPLTKGPMLAILEDETGTGKTEAALLLAHRMALAGKGRGLFFAMPTMATADAMFQRVTKVIGQMFDQPSVTLAHGRAKLSVPFRELTQGSRTGQDLNDNNISSSEWFAASNRRALLADIGIGTIDQALLSVLPVKFQTLRHFGLSSKILIVDEVHEMGEPYIAEELVALLKQHRARGGSAILLTATLPLVLRKKLLAVYGGHSDSQAYPAISVAQGECLSEFASDDRPKRGKVAIKRLDTEQDAVAMLVEKAAAGAACVWVRNAVDDAIAAVEALRAQGQLASLLHARFTLEDRKEHEADVLKRAGKDGTDRAGYVLVGTQVLESSLDLDFDVMVSDIAPVAALVQRAGRLWRHMDKRPAETRPVPAPVLYVLSPDPDTLTDDRWLHGTLDRGAWVYTVSDIWRTARVVFQKGYIDAPEGLRALIESVHGDQAEDVPDALCEAEERRLGKASAERGLARQNIVDFTCDYREGGRGADDVLYPTRLGAEQRLLCVARRTSEGLVPWAKGETGQEAWALSEVSAVKSRLDRLSLPDQNAPDIKAVIKDWPEWKKREMVLCPVDEAGNIGDGLRYDQESGLIFGSL